MCIRDRANPTDPIETVAALEEVAPAAAVATVDVPSTTIVAVSYTHLRAHETVLDLVCRLLLDKKKTQTQQTQHCYFALH